MTKEEIDALTAEPEPEEPAAEEGEEEAAAEEKSTD